MLKKETKKKPKKIKLKKKNKRASVLIKAMIKTMQIFKPDIKKVYSLLN